MDDRPRRQPAQEEHGQAIDVGGAAEQVEAKRAEDRPHLHALQPVGAAGDDESPCWRASASMAATTRVCISRVRPVVRRMMSAGQEPDQAAATAAGEQAGDRLAPAIGGEDAGGIGAGAEERGVAQGDDAGIAEHQIEPTARTGWSPGSARPVPDSRETRNRPRPPRSHGSASSGRKRCRRAKASSDGGRAVVGGAIRRARTGRAAATAGSPWSAHR